MTDRERFLATMSYQPRDRAPICDFGFWQETFPEWIKLGWPAHPQLHNYQHNPALGMDSWSTWMPINVGLHPGFGWEVLEDLGDREIVRIGDGTTELRHKRMGSIPMHLDWLLKDRASWREHYLPRLDPDTPGRLPENPAEALLQFQREHPSEVLTVSGGSLYGWLRNWMGVEAVSYLVYDDPAFFEEMVETLCHLTCTVLERAFQTGVRVDAVSLWEDMCYNAGPLLGPKHFRQFLVPRYQRITELCRRHGVSVIYLDSDGRIDELVPLWLEGGVDTLFPIEVGTWGGDPVAFRARYGKSLRMLGGFSKLTLARGPEAIDREIERLTPLVEEGGYIPLPDHRVPPDVPWRNYLHYLKQARRVWGRGINLHPMDPVFEALMRKL